MLPRFASLQTEAHDTELPNVVHPFLKIGQDRMRNRVVELIAIMTIQVALFGHVQVRNPWFGVKNASDLLERERSFHYHSHRSGVQQARQVPNSAGSDRPGEGGHVSNFA